MKNNKRVKIMKGILALILILSLFIPYSVGHPQMDFRALVVAMGLDQLDDNTINVSVKVTLPVEGGGAVGASQILEESGETVAEALDNLSVSLGRKMELSHLGILVIGKEFNKIEELEYLLCSGQVCPKINLTLSDNENAKEFLKVLSDYSDKLELSNLLKYMDLGAENHSQSLISFLTDINSVSKASLIPCIKMSYSDESGQEKEESSNGENSGENAKNEGEKKQPKIESIKKTAVYDNKGLRNIYKEEETLGLGYLDNRNKKGYLFIEYEGSNLSLQLNKKKVKIATKIEDNQSIFSIKLNLSYTVEDKHRLDYKSIENDLKSKIEEKISFSINKAIESLRNDDTDAILIEDYFYRNNNKKYKQMRNEGYNFLKNSVITIEYNIVIN